MESLRSPFQGVWNIVRFNWHFYLIAAMSIVMLLISIAIAIVPTYLQRWIPIVVLVVLLTTLTSLFVSYYVYDLTGLYTLNWLDDLSLPQPPQILNINAGFDETSILINNKYPDASLLVFDFYDPNLHTEISIKRARKAYPPYPGSQRVRTRSLPLADQQVDLVFLILAAHEIRDHEERIAFFQELRRGLKIEGSIVVVEHHRDWLNFLAYNIGFLHFLSPKSWQKTFNGAQLLIEQKMSINPFIKAYQLKQK